MQRSSAKVQSELGATPAGSSSAVEDIIQPPPSASSRSPVVKKIKHLHKSDSSGEKNNESDKSNEDNDENYLIYDSFSLHFNWRTTLEQLALNITFPLLIPFFIHKFGWLFLHAQSFWPSAAGIIGTWWVTGCLVVMVVCFLLSPDDLGFQVAFPVCLYIMHRSMIALKYGTLSPTEYSKIVYGSDTRYRKGSGFKTPYPSPRQIDAVNRYQGQLQLISGWNNLTNTMIEHEITGASTRVGFNLKRYFFVLAPVSSSRSARLQFLRWKRLLSHKFESSNEVAKNHDDEVGTPKGMHLQADGSYNICLDDACAALIADAKSPVIVAILRFMIFAISAMNACIPIVLTTGPTSVLTKVYFATSFFLNWMLSIFILSFLQTAFMDFYRRWLFSNQLATLIRVDDHDSGIMLHTNEKQNSSVYTSSFHRSTFISSSSKTQRSQSSSSSCLHKSTIDDSKAGAKNAGDRAVEAWSGKDSIVEYKSTPLKLDNSVYFEFPHNFDLESGSQQFEEGELGILPRLDMTIPQNYVSWLVARTVMRNFGARFLFRLNIYNGVVLLLSFVLVLGSLAVVVQSDNPKALANSPTFIYSLTWIFFFSVSQAIIIFVGALVNQATESQGSSLALHMLSLKNTARLLRKSLDNSSSSSPSPSSSNSSRNELTRAEVSERCENAEECVEAGELVIGLLDQREGVEVLKVLGFKCETNLSVGIMSSRGVFGFTLLQIVFVGQILL